MTAQLRKSFIFLILVVLMWVYALCVYFWDCEGFLFLGVLLFLFCGCD